jgi:hypothetical protein
LPSGVLDQRATAVSDALLLYGNQAPKEPTPVKSAKDQIKHKTVTEQDSNG